MLALLADAAGQEAPAPEIVASASAPAAIPSPETTSPAADSSGCLMICGGGRLPDVIQRRFVELAGGKEARIVVIPTATSRTLTDELIHRYYLDPWQAHEPASVTLLHTESRETANDPAFVEPLKKATGVWIGGGNQTRLADVYLRTAVEAELYALLKRGGVIGGTSAGAAVQSRVMIARGAAEPVIATGFDLLPGAVIDQHFLKRKRLPRLTHAVANNPGLVGFGTDEGTAMVVRGGQVEVLGDSTVTVVLPSAGADQPPEHIELKPNTTTDLVRFRRTALERTKTSAVSVESPETLSR